MADEQTTTRRWRPRFSLLALLLGVIFLGACGGLWWRWEPWVLDLELGIRTHRFTQLSAVSSSGERMVLMDDEFALSVWDTTTGREVTAPTDSRVNKFCVACSPDGRRVAEVAEEVVRIWDGQDGSLVAVLKGHTAEIMAVSFSPDSCRVATFSDDGECRTWNTETGQQVMVLSCNAYGASSMSYSPDGKRIATGGLDSSRVWDVQSGKELFLLEGTGRIHAVVFSPDGRRIATVSKEGTRVWDLETMKYTMFAGRMRPSVFSRNDRVVTVKKDSAYVWDLSKGHMCAEIKEAPGDPIRTAELSTDGRRVVTISKDRVVGIWDAQSGESLSALSGHPESMVRSQRVKFAPAGRRMFTMGIDGIVRVWSRRRPEYVWGIAWLPEFWIALVSGTALLYLGCCSFSRQFQTQE